MRSSASSWHSGELAASWHVPPAVETPQGWSTLSEHSFFFFLFPDSVVLVMFDPTLTSFFQ